MKFLAYQTNMPDRDSNHEPPKWEKEKLSISNTDWCNGNARFNAARRNFNKLNQFSLFNIIYSPCSLLPEYCCSLSSFIHSWKIITIISSTNAQKKYHLTFSSLSSLVITDNMAFQVPKIIQNNLFENCLKYFIKWSWILLFFSLLVTAVFDHYDFERIYLIYILYIQNCKF